MKQKTDIVVDLSAYRKELEQTQQELEFYRNEGEFNGFIIDDMDKLTERQGKLLTIVENLLDISKGQQQQLNSLNAVVLELQEQMEELNVK